MAGNSDIVLKWEYHHTDLALKFHRLLQLEKFVDVTLAAEGGSLKAHRLVLSSYSKYFEEILSEQPPDSHVTIILDDISFKNLNLLIEYMYKGKVTVSQEELPALLKAASGLQIKATGLLNETHQDCEIVDINTPSEPDATNDDLVSQQAPESSIMIPSPFTGSQVQLPALENKAAALQIIGVMNLSGDNDAAFNSGSETIDTDPFVFHDQDSIGSPTDAALPEDDSFVSIPNVRIPKAKDPEEEGDPLIGETGNGEDGALMEWENTVDELQVQNLLANAEILRPMNNTNVPVVLLDEGVRILPDELKKLKAELALRRLTDEQDVDRPNRKTIEGSSSDTETKGSSENGESTESSRRDAATSFLDDSTDEDSIPFSKDGENNAGEEEEEDTEYEEGNEMDQTCSSEDVDSDSSDENFGPQNSSPATPSRSKATKPSSTAKTIQSNRMKKKGSAQQELPFKCSKCSRSYSHRGNLARHVKMECGKEPQFRCIKCDYSFRQKSKLQSHLVNFHQIDRSQLAKYGAGPKVRPVQPFSCKKCGRTYKQKRFLNHHVKHICGVDPSFFCRICDFRTKEKYLLEGHIRHVHGVDPSA